MQRSGELVAYLSLSPGGRRSERVQGPLAEAGNRGERRRPNPCVPFVTGLLGETPSREEAFARAPLRVWLVVADPPTTLRECACTVRLAQRLCRRPRTMPPATIPPGGIAAYRRARDDGAWPRQIPTPGHHRSQHLLSPTNSTACGSEVAELRIRAEVAEARPEERLLRAEFAERALAAEPPETAGTMASQVARSDASRRGRRTENAERALRTFPPVRRWWQR
jgi:hypothetical protein